MQSWFRACLVAVCMFPCLVFGNVMEASLKEAKQFIASKQYKEALATLEASKSHTLTDEQHFSMLLLQGQALFGLKELNKAGRKGEGALSLFQNDPEALILMGQIEKAKGHNDVAGALFWRVLKDHPKHPIARSEVAALQMEESMMDPMDESDAIW